MSGIQRRLMPVGSLIWNWWMGEWLDLCARCRRFQWLKKNMVASSRHLRIAPGGARSLNPRASCYQRVTGGPYPWGRLVRLLPHLSSLDALGSKTSVRARGPFARWRSVPRTRDLPRRHGGRARRWGSRLRIRAGYDIAFNCSQEVPILLMLSVRCLPAGGTDHFRSSVAVRPGDLAHPLSDVQQ